ncbi:MAG: hypothetical protein WCF33_17780, partial [Pseudonocardiaceae bacterium]
TARLLDDAIRAAQSIPAEGWANYAAAGFAGEVVALDPDRAVSLARSIPDGYDREMALADMAKAMAAADPNRTERLLAHAERIARSAHGYDMAEITAAISVVDPDCAKPFLDDRERDIRSSLNTSRKYDDSVSPGALANVAMMAAVDSDRAERLARSIPKGGWKAAMLAGIAKAVAAVDPDRAERLVTDAQRLAQSITDRRCKASALVDVVKNLTHSQ